MMGVVITRRLAGLDFRGKEHEASPVLPLSRVG